MSAGNALTDPQAMLNASPGSIGSLSLDHHRINRHAKLEKPAEQDLQRPSNSQISGTNGHVTSLSAQVAVARMSLVESMGFGRNRFHSRLFVHAAADLAVSG